MKGAHKSKTASVSNDADPPLKKRSVSQKPKRKKPQKTKMPDDSFNEPAAAGESARAEDRFESGKAHVSKAAEDLRAAAEAKAHELRVAAEAKAHELRATAEAKAAEWRGKAEHAYSEAQDRAKNWRDDGERYVRDNPSRAVMTALGVGFLLGLIFRR